MAGRYPLPCRRLSLPTLCRLLPALSQRPVVARFYQLLPMAVSGKFPVAPLKGAVPLSQNMGLIPACLHNSFAVILSNEPCLLTGIVLMSLVYIE